MEFKPGDPCVIFRPSRNSYGTGTFQRDEIDRVLKRDIVTKGGHRFNKERLSTPNGTWESLLHPDDPKIAKVVEANRHERRIQAVTKACDEALALARRDRNPDAAVALLAEFVEEATS